VAADYGKDPLAGIKKTLPGKGGFGVIPTRDQNCEIALICAGVRVLRKPMPPTLLLMAF